MTAVFKQALRDIWSGMANQVTRASHVLSAYSKDGQRTMSQVTGFDGETHQDIELLLPYGMSAIPVGQTGDFIIFQVNAARDHKVGFACDDPALRISPLAAGEFGFKNTRGTQVVWRNNKLEVTAPQDDIDVTAAQGNINITASASAINILASKGNVDVTASEGNVAVTASEGNVAVAASAGTITGHAGTAITLTAPPGTITANGNVLG